MGQEVLRAMFFLFRLNWWWRQNNQTGREITPWLIIKARMMGTLQERPKVPRDSMPDHELDYLRQWNVKDRWARSQDPKATELLKGGHTALKATEPLPVTPGILCTVIWASKKTTMSAQWGIFLSLFCGSCLTWQETTYSEGWVWAMVSDCLIQRQADKQQNFH